MNLYSTIHLKMCKRFTKTFKYMDNAKVQVIAIIKNII